MKRLLTAAALAAAAAGACALSGCATGGGMMSPQPQGSSDQNGTLSCRQGEVPVGDHCERGPGAASRKFF